VGLALDVAGVVGSRMLTTHVGHHLHRHSPT
jgi:hypothetical protein